MAPSNLRRIRGKRNAPKEAKWHYGKQRKFRQTAPAAASEAGSSTRSISSASFTGSTARQRRKKRPMELSRLEQLPTEVIQAVFEFSANLDLPLSSTHLASQLASRHLYHSLTSIVLQPVLDGRDPGAQELQRALRMMNSRFFTWSFFKSWLHEEFEKRHLLAEWRNTFGNDQSQWNAEQREEWIWYKMRPSGKLPPPTKLFRGPFTRDKIRLLRFLTSTFRADPIHLEPGYIEEVKQGFRQAVFENARASLNAFWTLGMEPDTELLRIAVIDSGCDKDVVKSLVSRVLHLASDPIEVLDFLDPALWSWAEKVQRSGNEKGQWLKELLRDAAMQSGRRDEEVERVKETEFQ